jgi:hypothetical protein
MRTFPAFLPIARSFVKALLLLLPRSVSVVLNVAVAVVWGVAALFSMAIRRLSWRRRSHLFKQWDQFPRYDFRVDWFSNNDDGVSPKSKRKKVLK